MTMPLFTLFLAGALLCNSVPHLVAGLQGKTFPTPFARPRGVGHSSAPVNFLWGAANLALGLARLASHPVTLGANLDCLVLALGALTLGLYLAWHFGKSGAAAPQAH